MQRDSSLITVGEASPLATFYAMRSGAIAEVTRKYACNSSWPHFMKKTDKCTSITGRPFVAKLTLKNVHSLNSEQVLQLRTWLVTKADEIAHNVLFEKKKYADTFNATIDF